MDDVIERLATLEKQAADHGFAWPNVEMVLDQVQSECQEIRQAVHQNEGPDRVQEEVGDLLHAALCLCFYMDINIEATLTKSANKFEKRLSAMLKIAAEQGYTDLKNENLDTLLQLWSLAKQQDNC